MVIMFMVSFVISRAISTPMSESGSESMIPRKKGKIINISSQTGTIAIPQRAAYCSSKGGVNQLTKLLAIEWAQYNINVNAIAPGYFANLVVLACTLVIFLTSGKWVFIAASGSEAWQPHIR
jgi:NAD(P)-dependent dehydrogenase (short-subunit alcohol dehydrogenase family)